MHNLTRIFIYSIIYLTLYNLPLVYFKHEGLLNWSALQNIILIIPALFILFSIIILLLPKFLSLPFNMLLFSIGAIATYYLVTFGKTLDVGVIIDLLSVEMELITEYISWILIVLVFISLILPIVIEFILHKFPILIPNKIIITIELACLIFMLLNNVSEKIEYKARFLLDHPPFKHINVTQQFLTKYRKHMNITSLKRDLTQEHKVEFSPSTNKPLTVVLVIGESMRGDINSLNGYSKYDNMPFMERQTNLISFPKAKSSATSTRKAIPYMLTNAIPPDFEAATGTKGITSIFKHLGFKTSWLGNQGLFGAYETTYASNALESDFIISKLDLQIHLNQKFTYDEDLLPYIKEKLNGTANNNFIVIHLIGSHWHFQQRYPEKFGHKFMPICEARSISQCTQQEILNSYHNTITYTDYVLSLILQELINKNALLIYASDHGFSLNERKLFGNAYEGPEVPKEQLSIEMFSWASDEFMQDNKKAYNNILKNKNKDISHDYIFHSLLDCSGVKADFIDLNLSICY